MKVAGLFAGIGGLELGLAEAGHESHLLCEIWPPARSVLLDQFSDVPCVEDVRELDDLPEEIDLLVAGFPCQDLSQAGLTAGIGGSRSGLVGQVFRLLDKRPVPLVVLENVPFMLSLARGEAMRAIVSAFEYRGYSWAYRVVNSLSFLPQRRERVLFVASRGDIDPADILLVDEAEPHILATDLSSRAHGFYWTEGTRGVGWATDSIPTLKNGSTVGIPSPPAIMLPTGNVITPDIRDAERLQGFAEDWTLAASRSGKASLRWSLIGNAVSVPVARWLGERLARPGAYDRTSDRELPASGKWPRAARSVGVTRRAVDINAYPTWAERLPLHQFLNYPGKPLSARATRGFLSRAEKGTLRFAPGFLDGLRKHLSAVEKSPLFEPEYAVAAE